jgi:hypothetical protein
MKSSRRVLRFGICLACLSTATDVAFLWAIWLAAGILDDVLTFLIVLPFGVMLPMAIGIIAYTSARNNKFRYALYFVVCYFGVVWCPFLVDLLEPLDGSGNFGLHLVSLLIAVGTLNVLILDTICCLCFPRMRFRGRLSTTVGLHVFALASVSLGLVTLFNF